MCEDVKPLKLLKHDLIHQVSLKVVEVNTQSLLHVAYILQDIPRVGIWSEKLWKRYLGEIFAVIVRIGSSSWLIFWWVMLMVFHAFSVFAPVLCYALLIMMLLTHLAKRGLCREHMAKMGWKLIWMTFWGLSECFFVFYTCFGLCSSCMHVIVMSPHHLANLGYVWETYGGMWGLTLWEFGILGTMKSLKVLVTGASSGLGKAVAIQLARQGHSLFLTGRNEQRLGEAARQCKGA